MLQLLWLFTVQSFKQLLYSKCWNLSWWHSIESSFPSWGALLENHHASFFPFPSLSSASYSALWFLFYLSAESYPRDLSWAAILSQFTWLSSQSSLSHGFYILFLMVTFKKNLYVQLWLHLWASDFPSKVYFESYTWTLSNNLNFKYPSGYFVWYNGCYCYSCSAKNLNVTQKDILKHGLSAPVTAGFIWMPESLPPNLLSIAEILCSQPQLAQILTECLAACGTHFTNRNDIRTH